jgi:branched-chain amino acid transport system substrate-binding protein
MLHSVVLAGVGAVVAALASVPVAASTPAVRGVTRTTVMVGGLVPADPAAAGADLGAKARFARAGRIGGRTIEYLGAANSADTTAVARLTSDAFAVVPAIDLSDAAQTLARAGIPFVGTATSATWHGNRYAFGITGSGVSERGRSPNPAWGRQLSALLGGSQGKTVAIVTDQPAAVPSASSSTPRPAVLQDAGFTVATPIVLRDPPSMSDVTAVAQTLMTQNPAAVLVLTPESTVVALEQQLAALGFVGTVATEDALYSPNAPAPGAGVTVLVTIAPLESRTAALRQMVDDIRAIDSAAAITPAMVDGYFAADFLVRVLRRVGRRLTVERFLDVANRDEFSYEIPATIGRSTWPAMHERAIPCGALVEGDGAQYVVAEPYRCVPDVTKPKRR